MPFSVHCFFNTGPHALCFFFLSLLCTYCSYVQHICIVCICVCSFTPSVSLLIARVFSYLYVMCLLWSHALTWRLVNSQSCNIHFLPKWCWLQSWYSARDLQISVRTGLHFIDLKVEWWQLRCYMLYFVFALYVHKHGGL